MTRRVARPRHPGCPAQSVALTRRSDRSTPIGTPRRSNHGNFHYVDGCHELVHSIRASHRFHAQERRRCPGAAFCGPEFAPQDDFRRGDSKAQQTDLFELEPPPWELESQEETAIATVVFSEAPHGPYDYRIPESLLAELQPGMRVRVPLGKRRKSMIGWCTQVELGIKVSRPLRDLEEILDPEPLCDASLVRLVLWMSHYYQAPAGQVFDTLIPSSVRSHAGTRQRTYYSLSPAASDEAAIEALPKKQKSVIRFLIAAGRPMTASQLMVEASCTQDPIKRLQGKGFLLTDVRREMASSSPMRWQLSDGEAEKHLKLTDDQTHALARIVAAIDSGKSRSLVLHGVTGSGKTEVYIRAIEHVVRFGRGAIVLVPEISLTPQTRGRFERRFRSVAVLHSQMTPAERHFQWQRIHSGEVQVVVGPRSAVFAPFPRLGLIILDEEHDASFKQDTQPRYHARKVAFARASSLGGPAGARIRDTITRVLACDHHRTRRIDLAAQSGQRSSDAGCPVGRPSYAR